MTRVAGVDGCRGGWLKFEWDLAKQLITMEVCSKWVSLPSHGITITAVDMPIGLKDRGSRDCDLEARRKLPRGRKSSVFPPPRRYMLDCRDWAEAQAKGRAAEACGLSKQTWNITGKIRELDESMVPEDQTRIREVHPELVFHHLNGWEPLPNKKSLEGRTQRLKILHAAGLPDPMPMIQNLDRRLAAPDDLIDAGACAVAARRILEGHAICLPTNPGRDRRGLHMEIWF